ncbi:uncharacterized protein JN550_008729 [Neoarthrinium moseri]|uniref:uncharacterized protein n=1 Tax=Neoarthrinium moseri TaxID=1658444 RepID=UPI001FDD8627|nr:uncharacterized protein JN550_008729 [Neoarthrinium moseri]KAI1864909.1 hypothetical protein JN550_008729 [Neoarthrinium moseri]
MGNSISNQKPQDYVQANASSNERHAEVASVDQQGEPDHAEANDSDRFYDAAPTQSTADASSLTIPTIESSTVVATDSADTHTRKRSLSSDSNSDRSRSGASLPLKKLRRPDSHLIAEDPQHMRPILLLLSGDVHLHYDCCGHGKAHNNSKSSDASASQGHSNSTLKTLSHSSGNDDPENINESASESQSNRTETVAQALVALPAEQPPRNPLIARALAQIEEHDRNGRSDAGVGIPGQLDEGMWKPLVSLMTDANEKIYAEQQRYSPHHQGRGGPSIDHSEGPLQHESGAETSGNHVPPSTESRRGVPPAPYPIDAVIGALISHATAPVELRNMYVEILECSTREEYYPHLFFATGYMSDARRMKREIPKVVDVGPAILKDIVLPGKDVPEGKPGDSSIDLPGDDQQNDENTQHHHYEIYQRDGQLFHKCTVTGATYQTARQLGETGWMWPPRIRESYSIAPLADAVVHGRVYAMSEDVFQKFERSPGGPEYEVSVQLIGRPSNGNGTQDDSLLGIPFTALTYVQEDEFEFEDED